MLSKSPTMMNQSHSTTKKPTVTIAIPAFNEETTIVSILGSILNQSQSNFKLDQIIVASDGSTDQTISLVKTNFPKIKLFAYKDNLGKSKRVNQILKNNKSDVLVLADADIVLKSTETLNALIEPFASYKLNGISCAYHLANTPENFVEKIGYFGFKVWDSARNSLGSMGVRYYCEGGLLAYSKAFASEFRLPENRHVGDDSYSFYFAITHGYKVKVSKMAKVYINLASNLADYTRQMKRFLTDTPMVVTHFNQATIDKYETITARLKAKSFAKEMVKHPVLGLCYIALQIILKIQVLNYDQTIAWIPAKRKTH